jgi:hypothetical protein
MDCPELDALAVELQARLQRGAFRGLSPVTLDGGMVMDAELMARIVLDDIEDLCAWYPTRPTHPSGKRRLRAIQMDAQQLLQLEPA